MTEMYINYTAITRSPLERLNSMLATHERPVRDNLDDARRAVITLTYELAGPFYLMSMDNHILRKATLEETIESCLVSDEGFIEVDGVKCYVEP